MFHSHCIIMLDTNLNQQIPQWLCCHSVSDWDAAVWGSFLSEIIYDSFLTLCVCKRFLKMKAKKKNFQSIWSCCTFLICPLYFIIFIHRHVYFCLATKDTLFSFFFCMKSINALCIRLSWQWIMYLTKNVKLRSWFCFCNSNNKMQI